MIKIISLQKGEINMIPQNSNQANLKPAIAIDPKEKMKGLKVTNNISEISEQIIEDIPLGAINPNNNAAFEERSNPLSSKGN